MDRNLNRRFRAIQHPKSLSARRAWIEIEDWLNAGSLSRSLSARRAWIEIKKKGRARRPGQTSLSARRAWIEIIKFVNLRVLDGVALRKESVDRNGLLPLMYPLKYWVALRKESVDRNQAEISESRYTQSRSPQGERG